MPTMRLLRLGDTNASVLVLETKLRQLGFLKAFPNEVFEKETEQAVKDYQRFAGIGVDGVVGPDTWAALFGQPVARKAGAIREGTPGYAWVAAIAAAVLMYYIIFPKNWRAGR